MAEQRRSHVGVKALGILLGVFIVLGLCVGALYVRWRRNLLAMAPEYAADTPFSLWDALGVPAPNVTLGFDRRWLIIPGLLVLLIIVYEILLHIPLPRPSNPFDRDPRREFTQEDRRWIREAAGDRCEYRYGGLIRCRKHGGWVDKDGIRHDDYLGKKKGQLDHHYPWSKGGATTRRNLVYLCAHHNRLKTDETPSWLETWLLYRARLRYFPPALRGYAWPDGSVDESEIEARDDKEKTVDADDDDGFDDYGYTDDFFDEYSDRTVERDA